MKIGIFRFAPKLHADSDPSMASHKPIARWMVSATHFFLAFSHFPLVIVLLPLHVSDGLFRCHHGCDWRCGKLKEWDRKYAVEAVWKGCPSFIGLTLVSLILGWLMISFGLILQSTVCDSAATRRNDVIFFGANSLENKAKHTTGIQKTGRRSFWFSNFP